MHSGDRRVHWGWFARGIGPYRQLGRQSPVQRSRSTAIYFVHLGAVDKQQFAALRTTSRPRRLDSQYRKVQRRRALLLVLCIHGCTGSQELLDRFQMPRGSGRPNAPMFLSPRSTMPTTVL